MSHKMHENDPRLHEGVALDEKTEIDTPKMYTITMHNDDYTPMDFVVYLLIKVFRKSQLDAAEIMMDVHQKGQRIVGVYSYDVATTKLAHSQRLAESAGHPLKITMDEAR